MARSNRKPNRRPTHPQDGCTVVSPMVGPRSIVQPAEASSPSATPPTDGPNPVLPLSSPITERLDLLVELMTQLDTRLVHLSHPVIAADRLPVDQPQHHDPTLEFEVRSLQTRVEELLQENGELQQQNDDLAAQLAQANVRKSVRQSDGLDESLSWEQRKALIFDQMESESFDADAFVRQLSTPSRSVADNVANPVEFVEDLIEKHRRAEQLATRRSEEIEELRMLLHQQAEDRQSGVVIGAASIAGMIDSDELVQEERARLQELKSQWEEKIRETEIAASLERAKLSRERQDLARRASELESQLELLQRQQREQAEPAVPGGRRWLAELGLGSRSQR